MEGLAKCVHTEDGYNEYVSIPVNIYDAGAVAAGVLKLTYDPDELELADIENATADGIYVNVRFKVKEDATRTGTGKSDFFYHIIYISIKSIKNQKNKKKTIVNRQIA